MTNLDIFKYFLYLGIAGFGGPLAIIDYIRRDLVLDKKWMTLDEFTSYFGYSQIAPGPLAFQVTLYFCYFKKGFWAAILGFFGLVFPSFIIVLFFSIFYKEYRDVSYISGALYGLSPVIIAIIFYSGFNLSRTIFTKDKFLYILFFAVILVLYFWKVHILYMIISSAAVSLLYYTIKEKKDHINSFSGFFLIIFLQIKTFLFGFIESIGNKLIQITLVFMKAGALTYGSGFVIIGVLRQDIVVNLGWLTTKEFIDGIAFGQITPGPVVITSTFIGYMVSGISGAILATVSIFLPTFIIVMILTQFIKKIEHNFYLKSAIKGANAAAIAAIITTAYFLSLDALIDVYTIGLFIISLLILLIIKIKPYYLIVAGAVLGIALKLL